MNVPFSLVNSLGQALLAPIAIPIELSGPKPNKKLDNAAKNATLAPWTIGRRIP